MDDVKLFDYIQLLEDRALALYEAICTTDIKNLDTFHYNVILRIKDIEAIADKIQFDYKHRRDV